MALIVWCPTRNRWLLMWWGEGNKGSRRFGIKRPVLRRSHLKSIVIQTQKQSRLLLLAHEFSLWAVCYPSPWASGYSISRTSWKPVVRYRRHHPHRRSPILGQEFPSTPPTYLEKRVFLCTPDKMGRWIKLFRNLSAKIFSRVGQTTGFMRWYLSMMWIVSPVPAGVAWACASLRNPVLCKKQGRELLLMDNRGAERNELEPSL